MTKIDIVSGFLGAGKTTLIKKLIAEAFSGEKIVLIENEFGEIGIDGGFLKDAGIEITEMNSGCICCSLVGDFGTALKEVIEKFTPDRIIIEPSGVGKLSDVMTAVQNVGGDITINSTTAVVDGLKTRMYMKNFGEFFNNQVESAGTIIISRSQKMPEKALDECVSALREHNPEATMITTAWDDINGKQILAAMEEKKSLRDQLMEEEEICPECGHHHHHDHHHDECECGHDHDHEHEHEHEHHDECGCGHDHHHHHADEVFTSWGITTPHKFNKSDIEEALKKLSETEEYGTILRAKGIVPDVDGTWIYFDLVPGEYELRTGDADYTGKLCVIGKELREDELPKLFGIE